MTDALRGAYRVMRTIRAVEDRVGTGHPGEEALAVGVCLHLDGRDAIAGTHRRHGQRIAKGADVRGVMAEAGKHRPAAADALGGVPLLICGAAIAAKQHDTGGVGVAFLGDGATTTLEALNLASAWHLPAIFVTENPGYADRVAGLGVPAVVVDGSDFFAVHEAAGEAVGRARDGGGPTLIEAGFPRHVGDCLQRFRTRVTDSGELREQVLDAIDAEVARLVEDSVAAPEPAPAGLETGVYLTY
ncbi:thiamine pyrophosphate-dependent enzyme [Amycolatopsis sp.]|uniref:thiamine pyrophosphate-dependent enzyme n=1 Tax=Amycolatopsis sp. TaxID=37632 RepID=UPI002D7E6C50|nr:thiamine pyrophosphate-dependent enzyme [Amycolatopsis sp.]HET6705407.1 thiamine pyrophosphate-dependent enzyme [Amycolatopsis sp.]